MQNGMDCVGLVSMLNGNCCFKVSTKQTGKFRCYFLYNVLINEGSIFLLKDGCKTVHQIIIAVFVFGEIRVSHYCLNQPQVSCSDLPTNIYGQSLHIGDWKRRKHLINLTSSPVHKSVTHLVTMSMRTFVSLV